MLVNYIIASNTPFSQVENSHFKELISSLSKNYTLPTRKYLSTVLVDKIYSKINELFRNKISGHKVTLFQDGWTNVRNESIIVNSILFNNKSYVIDLFAPGSARKNSEYLPELARDSMKKLDEEYSADVIGICTDNASVMVRMRKILWEDDHSLIAVGCAAHSLNLLAKDICNERIVEQVVSVQKYFKYHHKASGYLSIVQGSLKPILPSSIRWSSVYLSLNNFLKILKYYMGSTQVEDLIDDAAI
eukprot:GAHX01003778.1.p1 GENE.GAHX01003778.1~~GAHX01003778.1.p1  ORF type:complete len:246 (-),score=23.70 GAHX01003778.1:1169-1906(-)